MVHVTQFLTSIPWFAWIAIVAIVCGAVTKIVAMRQEHVERMAQIQQGYAPDTKKPARYDV